MSIIKVMTGFEVRFKDKVIYASVDDESILAMVVTHARNSTNFEIAAGLASKEHINIAKQIEDSDKITIKVVDLEHNSETVNSETVRSHPDEDINAYFLENYFFEKKELENNGLL
jgi:hypothetical protein